MIWAKWTFIPCPHTSGLLLLSGSLKCNYVAVSAVVMAQTLSSPAGRFLTNSLINESQVWYFLTRVHAGCMCALLGAKWDWSISLQVAKFFFQLIYDFTLRSDFDPPHHASTMCRHAWTIFIIVYSQLAEVTRFTHKWKSHSDLFTFMLFQWFSHY